MWNPRKPLGGQRRAELLDARVILWHGFCSVHRRFTVDQIDTGPRRAPRRAGDRAPRVPDGRRRRRGRRRLDGLHREGHRGRAGRLDLRDRHRGQPRAAPRRGVPAARRSSASTRWSARARRCTASTPATSRGCSRSSSRARWSTASRAGRCGRARPARPRADARGEAAGRARSPRGVMTRPVPASSRRRRHRRRTAVKAADAGTRGARPLVTKAELADANTRYAQGGIARPCSTTTRVERHFADTLVAGAGLCRSRRGAGALRRGSWRGPRPHPLRGGVRPRRLGTRRASRPPTRTPASSIRAAMPPAPRSRRPARRDRAARAVRIVRATMPGRPDRAARRVGGAELLVARIRRPRRHRRRRRRARDRRLRMPLPAHDQPRRSRPGDGVAAALRAGAACRRPGVLPVPPDGARDARHAAHLRGRARRGRRAARRGRRRFMLEVDPDG